MVCTYATYDRYKCRTSYVSLKERTRRHLRANEYDMYAGQTPRGQTGILCEKWLRNQEAAAVRDQLDNEAEILKSLGMGQSRQFHFVPTHPP